MSRKRGRRRNRNDEVGRSATVRSPQSPNPESKRLRGWRKWVLRLCLVVLAPVLFFGLMEGGLRLAGYGYPAGFFIGPDASGSYITNTRFGWRFFPRSLAREPCWASISTKPANTVRVFVLGSSAAYGTPDASFSFGRILEVMLRKRYPGMQFEVVNAAMTAINSHVGLEIARDCAAHQPDLFVVYMGNNEVIGPYGPGTVFQGWSPSLATIRASIWLKSMRLGQCLGDVIGGLGRGSAPPSHWRGLAMFTKNQVAADDPRLEAVYRNFRQNLIDICRIARRAGAGVILSTVAVNLNECPPLASEHRRDLSADDLKKWQSHYQAGVDLDAKGRRKEAAEQYEAAAQIDDRFAELQFRLGRCRVAAGDMAEARQRFVLARDLDVLRFRADTRINATIREVAAEEAADDIRLVDAEQTLTHRDQASGDVLGGNLFYEHVHLTFDGNYALARAVLEQAPEAVAALARFRSPKPPPSRAQCAELLALTPWDQLDLTCQMLAMTSQDPFTNQIDHAERQAEVSRRRDSLRKSAFAPGAMQAAWKTHEAALAKQPDDCFLHARFGTLALECNRPDVAVEHFGFVAEKLPWVAEAQCNLGVALASSGKTAEARRCLEKALQLKYLFADPHYNLGLLIVQDHPDEAIIHFQKALEFQPDHTEAHKKLGIIFAQREILDEAIAHLEKAVQLDPDDPEARANFGVVLGKQGRFDEAILQLQKSAEDRPDAATRKNLQAVLTMAQGEHRALEARREALRTRPDDKILLNEIAWTLATNPNTSLRNGAEAVKLAERAARLVNDGEPAILDTLAAAYAEAGRFADAAKTARQASDLARQQGKQSLAKSIDARLLLYEAGTPYRELRQAPPQ